MDIQTTQGDDEAQVILEAVRTLQETEELRTEAATNPESVMDRLGLSGVARHAVAFGDSSGAERTVHPAAISPSSLWLMGGGALLFVLLGGIVYRWSADPVLGRLFLLLNGSFATALVAAPAGLLGFAWAANVTPAA